MVVVEEGGGGVDALKQHSAAQRLALWCCKGARRQVQCSTAEMKCHHAAA